MVRATVEVALVHGPVEAELVRGLLESYAIAVRLDARFPHAILPLCIEGPGEVRVLVAADDAPLAAELIAGHRRAGLKLLAAADPAADER